MAASRESFQDSFPEEGKSPSTGSTSHQVKHFTLKTAAADCSTAMVVALSAAVPISIIDYSIMSRVAGVTDSSMKELWKGIRTVCFRPHKFFLPCAENKCFLVYSVCATTYGFTYMGSNLSKSYCESQGMGAEANLAAGVVSGVINTFLTIWKDTVILKALPPVNMGAAENSKRAVPWFTRGLFCCRDTLTCVAAFTLAPLIASWLTNYTYHSGNRSSSASTAVVEHRVPLPLSPADTAQILTPAMLQFVTTLMHITAIRYRQTYPKFDWPDLKQSLKETYISSTLLRMCRIIPAFGIGGILNRELRSNMLDKAEPS